MKSHQTDFSKGNVYRNICEVAVPMIFAQLLNLLYNVVDRIYIGKIPEIGATALTGVGLCFPIITLVSAFTYLYGTAARRFVPWNGAGAMTGRRKLIWGILLPCW